MSKSLGNYVAVEDEPAEMYGKLMSISDDLMWKYWLIQHQLSTYMFLTSKYTYRFQPRSDFGSLSTGICWPAFARCNIPVSTILPAVQYSTFFHYGHQSHNMFYQHHLPTLRPRSGSISLQYMHLPRCRLSIVPEYSPAVTCNSSNELEAFDRFQTRNKIVANI